MSYTAFRRRIKPGVKLRIENARYPRLNREVRVVKVQTNAFTSPATRADGSPVESWLYWPKAACANVIDADTITLTDDGVEGPWLTLTVLEDA